jgi:hypothetical protein
MNTTYQNIEESYADETSPKQENKLSCRFLLVSAIGALVFMGLLVSSKPNMKFQFLKVLIFLMFY